MKVGIEAHQWRFSTCLDMNNLRLVEVWFFKPNRTTPLFRLASPPMPQKRLVPGNLPLYICFFPVIQRWSIDATQNRRRMAQAGASSRRYHGRSLGRLPRFPGGIGRHLSSGHVPRNAWAGHPEGTAPGQEQHARRASLGFALLSLALKRHSDSPWACDAYLSLLDAVSTIDIPGDKALALAGGVFRPGIVQGFPASTPIAWLESLYLRSLAIIDDLPDPTAQALALSRVAINLSPAPTPSWVRVFFGALFDRAIGLQAPSDKAEALQGIASNLGPLLANPLGITSSSIPSGPRSRSPGSPNGTR